MSPDAVVKPVKAARVTGRASPVEQVEPRRDVKEVLLCLCGDSLRDRS